MKNKRKGLKIIVVLVCTVVLSLWIFGVFAFLFNTVSADESMTRTDVVKRVEALTESDKSDYKTISRLAYNYYYLSEFEQAEEYLRLACRLKPNEFNTHSMLAEVLYLQGEYDEAEQIMMRQRKKHPININVQAKTQARLMKIYYQTNKFDKVEGFGVIKMLGLGDFTDWMSSFEQTPYQLDWNGKDIVSVDLVLVNPLPVIKITVNNKSMYVLIDTGGDTLILDTEVANEIMDVTDKSIEGQFAGGMKADLAFTRAESLQIGDLHISNVPIMTLPLGHINDAVEDDINNKDNLPAGFKISGVIGEKMFQQVLGALDYPNKTLILANKERVSPEEIIEERDYVKFPFYLAEMHELIVRGKLNQRPVTYWLDSGLASKHAVQVNKQTLLDFDIPIPDVEFNANAVGGGGTGIEVGDVENMGITGIGRYMIPVSGEYTPGEDFYWDEGFIIEGMLSHSYLKNYTWIIDYDNMQMYLVNNEK